MDSDQIAATTMSQDPISGSENDLDSLLTRINQLTAGQDPAPPGPPSPSLTMPVPAPGATAPPATVDHTPSPNSVCALAEDRETGAWQPRELESLDEAGISEGLLEHLALRCLAAAGDQSGHQLAEQHGIPFRLIEPILNGLKQAQLVAYRGAAPMNNYVYQLTDLGRESAKKLSHLCSYFGTAPVTLNAYIESVSSQTLTKMHPTLKDLKLAFSDLLVNQKMLHRLGPAVNSGRGLFLFGAPGNGKTSIAERVTKAFGDTVWVPRAVVIDGEILRVFDPGLHEEVPVEETGGLLQTSAVDKRWVRIRRPTIVVGGELTMDALEVAPSSGNNVSEAPLQIKSNCGTLVIDDFGRQRMSTDELLNRWIVPLEKRYDFLQLVSGKKIRVPFDQLIIFSTNLEPKDLIDDAFLRRIPYKIEVPDPSEAEFRKLFEIMAPIVGLPYDPDAVDYLINTHYKPMGRAFRCCQPRDLLLQIRNYCHYLDAPPLMCKEYLDYAVENYFAIM
ncbi:MAG: AAA family ATPase [Pirellulales bacterium]|nr:AAA family ATPase [Pirellulales bacterium]